MVGGLSRLLFAGGLALGLVVVVLVLATGGGGEDDSVADADPGCIEQWNSDPAALAVGRHQTAFHRYSTVQVLRLVLDGDSFPADPGGACALAYAAAVPAKEREASAQVLAEGRWVALSTIEGVTPELLARLQDEAIEGANAGLDEQGRLLPY